MPQSLPEAEQKLEHVQDMIVQGERAYTDRQEELQDSIRQAEVDLQRVKREFGEYERVMVTTRAEDQKRSRDLDQRERELQGKERALAEQKREFKLERDRFYQTKDLQ